MDACLFYMDLLELGIIMHRSRWQTGVTGHMSNGAHIWHLFVKCQKIKHLGYGYFFVNLLHSLHVWLFDIWHLFDNLTSWHFDTSIKLKPPQSPQGYFSTSNSNWSDVTSYVLVFTWKPCGVHLVTTLCPHGHQMVSMWSPHDSHVDTMWLPHGNHMASMWTPCGFQVDTTWFQMWTSHGFHMETTFFWHGQQMVSTWTPCGFYVDTAWLPCAHHVLLRWTPHGFHVDIMWFPCEQYLISRCTPDCFKCGHHMVSMWTLHGFHMDTMWFLCGHNIPQKTKNSSAWSQLAFLFFCEYFIVMR